MKRASLLLCALLLAAGLAPVPATAQTAPPAEVRIVRDHYGVPHVYSDTQEGVAWGAGYAITVDRLWQMDVLRHLAKGRFQELWGPVPGFDEMDRTQRRLGYTNEELRAKVARMPLWMQKLYIGYVDGVNARINEVRTNPSLLPQEYTEFGIGQPAPWDVTDSVAIGDLLVETFGAGGGSELAQAQLLKFLQGKYGEGQEALAAFNDIRWLNDPAAPVSIPRDFDWETAPTFADPLPAKDWRRDARIGLTDQQRKPIDDAEDQGQPQIGTIPQEELVPDEPSASATQQLESHLAGHAKRSELVSFGSNAFITGPNRTDKGGTLQLGGPQVGHFVPEAIAEFGLHSPAHNWDMTGLTFAGSGPAVLIGRTPFFSWTTTTGNSDGGDIYVEKLGPEPETYIYEGKVERMDCRNEVIRNKNGTPKETLRVCRTRHGPVLSTDADNGVAYALRRAWFDAEIGSFEGFFGANFVTNVNEFATSVNKLQSNHNMFYADADGNYGYWHPGALPIRTQGTDVRLPQDGRFAETEWVRMRTAQEVPHAVNFPRGWLANWNNKPAVSWNNGDGANYGVVFRNVVWNELLEADPSVTFEDGELYNRLNATIETEFGFFRDHIVAAGRASDDEQVQAAAEALAQWNARRRDEDGDDKVDDEPGYSLWRNWRRIAIEKAFRDDLGDTFYRRASDSMLHHVIEGQDASLPPTRDWLNGQSVTEFLNEVMKANLEALATQFGSADMSTWQAAMPKHHYTRLNVRFYDCEVARAGGVTTGCDDRLPGNVRPLDYMNRGTYNHLVEYQPGTRPEVQPEADGALIEQRDGYSVRAESIISPGQSGFINQLGQQSPHYEDQHQLYEDFKYKPMPVREEDVIALGDGTVDTKQYSFMLDELVRFAGTNRVATAARASAESFEQASDVVIASARNFPDALAAAPLAAKLGGPLLLVSDGLDDATRAEITRLTATKATIVGGPAAVSAQAEQALQDAGLEVRRLSGANRFETAAAIAKEVVGSAPNGEVFIASGRSFADALSAGPVASAFGTVILLVEPDAVPDATAQALQDLGATRTYVLGGNAAVSEAVAQELPGPIRIAGNTRYATSAAIARLGLGRNMDAAKVFTATGEAFPDALAAGPIAAKDRNVVLLVPGSNAFGAHDTYELIGQRAVTVKQIRVFGGESAVTREAAERAQVAASQR